MLRRCIIRPRKSLTNQGWTVPDIQHNYNNNRFAPPRSMTVDPEIKQKEGETWAKWTSRLATDNAFEARHQDDRLYGGDNGMGKSMAMNELKHMDKRIQPFFHEDLSRNVLKNALFYDAPDGTQFTNQQLDGRIVGIMVYSETDRCKFFYEELREFQEKHRGDFVVIGISFCKEEMSHIMHTNGFSHISHTNGAWWIQRDLGFMAKGIIPLPRLYIVDGATGFVISTSGYTAVRVRPDTCFNDWVQHEIGHTWYDYMFTWHYGGGKHLI